MALDPKISNLKSSGTYRFEEDKSLITSANVSQTRLFVGYSKKGPFNTPVYVQDTKQFRSLFGDIDRTLEKKGSFFHRSCLEALRRSPIYVLNMLRVKDGKSNEDGLIDEVEAIRMSTSTAIPNNDIKLYPFVGMYNTDKFWYPDSESFLQNIIDVDYPNRQDYMLSEYEENDTNNLLNFTNVSQNPISIVVKKSDNAKAYNVTVESWYGSANIPSYLNKDSLISDYFVDVYVIKGDFGADSTSETPYGRFAFDPTFQRYYDKNNGLKRKIKSTDLRDTMFENFINESEIECTAIFTGCLIPNFVDKFGSNVFIEKVINNSVNSIGLLCSVNEELFDGDLCIDGIPGGLDLVGHNIPKMFSDPSARLIKTLSYQFELPKTYDNYDFFVQGQTINDIVEYDDDTNDVVVALNISNEKGLNLQIGDVLTFTINTIAKECEISGVIVDENDTLYEITRELTRAEVESGDVEISFTNGVDSSKIHNCFDVYVPSEDEFNFTLKDNQFLIQTNQTNISEVKVGNYVLSTDKEVWDDNGTEETSDDTEVSQLTRITEVKTVTDVAGTTKYYLVTCQSEVGFVDVEGSANGSSSVNVDVYKPLDTMDNYLQIYTLKGFTQSKYFHIPDGTNARQNEIIQYVLGTKDEPSQIFKGLIDREIISFRYLIDTFGLGLEENSKHIFTYLCKERKSAFAILNAPSAKDFRFSKDPSFKDGTALSSKYISEGGDLTKNPSWLYSLPTEEQGASWGAFYYPYVVVRDLGKDITVPPAAYISNNFVAKYDESFPWTLVAGVRRGVISGSGVKGVEISLDKEDRDYLEPFGLNPIVWKAGVGPTIFANKTAKQTPKSALSSINCREAVIYIQDGVESILKNYLFELNTPQTRLEIKTLVDNFISIVANNDGVYDFKTVMDETNNTPEVIDNNTGIIDVYIEPVKGMEILVQRTTILRTGAISSGEI